MEDFDQYESLSLLAEELASVAKTVVDVKEESYDIITMTLREKIHVPREQFKASYLVALLADKESTRIFDIFFIAFPRLISHLNIIRHTHARRGRGNQRSSPYNPRLTWCGGVQVWSQRPQVSALLKAFSNRESLPFLGT